MSGWPLVALGDVFEIARGGSPRPIDSYITDDPAGINWITISDASSGSKYITGTKRRIRPEGAQRSRRVQSGDFLLTNSMSFGRPYIMRTSGCIHDGWLVLSPRREDVDADYFYQLLSSEAVYSEFERRAAGATVKNLNIDSVKGVRISLPSLPEQRRIASILDQADALRAKRRAALAQLDTLTQSIFEDMCWNPDVSPRSWTKLRLEEVTSTITKGTTPTSVGLEFSDTGIPFIRVQNLVEGGVAVSLDPLFISLEAHRTLSRSTIRPLDLLVSIAGTIGRIAQVSVDSPEMNCNQAVAIVRPTDAVNADYLLCWLQGRDAQRQMRGAEVTGTISNLSLSQLRSLALYAPPLSLQLDFATRVAGVRHLKTSYRSSLTHLDTLFASLQHRAFRAEL